MKPLTDIQARKRADTICVGLRKFLPVTYQVIPLYIEGPEHGWGVRIYSYENEGHKKSIALDMRMERATTMQDVVSEFLRSVAQPEEQ